jgi:hypothetical protein
MARASGGQSAAVGPLPLRTTTSATSRPAALAAGCLVVGVIAGLQAAPARPFLSGDSATRYRSEYVELVSRSYLRPVQVLEADERAGQVHEREQDVGAPLVARLQPPVAPQPRQRSLHHVPVRPSLPLDSTPRRAILGVLPRRLGARRQRG